MNTGSYEPSNPLCMPFECFVYDSRKLPFPVESHWHYFAEMLLAKEGALRVQRGEEEIRLEPGDFLFISPRVSHAIFSADGEEVCYEAIKLDLNQLDETPSYAPDLKSIIGEAEQQSQPMLIAASVAEEIRLTEHFGECIREYRDHAYGYDLAIKSRLYLICTALVRLWMKNGYNIQSRTGMSDPIYSITSYIDRHIRESLKVEELARYCGLSYPWFAKRFREIYGISCKDYIEQVRISKVEHYLLFTDCDLTYISQETGYADCSHMIKDFKRLKNMTPGHFRAQRSE